MDSLKGTIKKKGFDIKKEAENDTLVVHTETYVEPSKLLPGEYLESWLNKKKYSVGI
ncbi:hypothetical protein GH866_22535 [Bacillus thuringiensis]|nr:hypothetical protein [Bacillus thuringiensis]